MKKTKISVITVCKNAVGTIEKTLLSMYGQTYQNIENIVIDAVSTDGTLEILEKYKDKISVLVSEPDGGIYDAMNKGIKLATGDIIYFLNATDSLYDETIFETVVKEFEAHSDLRILWGKVQFTEESEDTSFLLYDDINFKSDFLYKNPCHQVVFYKKDVFDEYGEYDKKYPIYADYDFNMRMLVVNNVRCKYIPKFLARFELGGISTLDDEENKKIQDREHRRIRFQNLSISPLFQSIYIIGELDKFFMRYFGTPAKAIKRTKLWKKFFNKTDGIFVVYFAKTFSLNMIQ
jgi:glycosyltransferase involved in cell wall biosynthesis